MGRNIEIREKIEDIMFSTSSNEEMVEILLQIVGTNSAMSGYDYIKESILKMLDLPNLVDVKVTKEIYYPVANKFKVENWTKVERAIRYCIIDIFKNSNISEERNKKIYIF